MFSIQQQQILVSSSHAYLHFGETAKCYSIKLYTNSAAVLRGSENEVGQGNTGVFIHNIELRCFMLLSDANSLANTVMKKKPTRTSVFPSTAGSSCLNRVSHWKELCHSGWSDTAHTVFQGNPNQKIQCFASGSFFNWLLLNSTKVLFCNLKKAKFLWKSEN